MNLRSLRFFLAVAENNGVQKAAESLHLTQPNISRALKALEEELNAQLFVRTARGVEITEEGELLRMRAEEILSLVDKTKAEFVDSKGSELSVTGREYLRRLSARVCATWIYIIALKKGRTSVISML